MSAFEKSPPPKFCFAPTRTTFSAEGRNSQVFSPLRRYAVPRSLAGAV